MKLERVDGMHLGHQRHVPYTQSMLYVSMYLYVCRYMVGLRKAAKHGIFAPITNAFIAFIWKYRPAIAYKIRYIPMSSDRDHKKKKKHARIWAISCKSFFFCSRLHRVNGALKQRHSNYGGNWNWFWFKAICWMPKIERKWLIVSDWPREEIPAIGIFYCVFYFFFFINKIIKIWCEITWHR